MRRLRLALLLVLSLILLAACEILGIEIPLGSGDTQGGEAAHSGEPTSLPGWRTYHNEKFAFALDVPPGWRLMETPNPDYPTESEQVWLSAEDFPPFSESVLPDILITISPESPTSRWEPQHFDDYRVELLVGELPVEGTYVSGVHKETGRREEVVIARLPGGAFLEMQRSGVEGLSDIFNQVVRTLRPDE